MKGNFCLQIKFTQILGKSLEPFLCCDQWFSYCYRKLIKERNLARDGLNCDLPMTQDRQNFHKGERRINQSVIWQKGESQKRREQENKTRQTFRKINISLACFVFLLPPFSDLPFCLITDEINCQFFDIKAPSIFISWKNEK